jgi:hypothetical protein
MRRGATFSRAAAAFAGAASVAALLGVCVRTRLATSCARAHNASLSRIESLSSRLGFARAYDDGSLAALQDSIERFRRGLGDAGTLRRISGLMSGRWSYHETDARQFGAYVLHRASAVLASPEVSDWPMVVDMVRSIEEQPGAAVSRIEIRSAGETGRTTFEFVRLAVLVQVRSAGSL